MRRLDYSWIILGTGFVILFFSGGSRFAFGLVLRPMTEDLGWSRSDLSLAISSFMVVSALALPIIGRLIDRYDIRWFLAFSAVLAAIGIGLMGLVEAQWQVFALYGVVYAIGNGGTSIAPVSVMISRWFTRRRGMATSAALAGNAAGQLVIIASLSALVVVSGWRWAFGILGIATFVLLVPLVLATVRSAPESAGDASGDSANTKDLDAPTSMVISMGQIFQSRQIWLLFAIYAICGFQDFFVATHVVAFALDQGMGSILAGNMLALMGLMGLIGVLLSGLMADAYGASRPTALCFLLRIAVFASILVFQDTLGILAFALLYGFTFLVTAPLTVVFANSIFGTSRLGTVSGLISMVHQMFGGLGAFVGGFVFDAYGSYDRVFVFALVLSVVAAGGVLLVREKPLVAVPRIS